MDSHTATNSCAAWLVAGDGSNGQLGNGQGDASGVDLSYPYNSSTPVQVSGDSSFATVCSGWSHSCAREPSGKAWCWGKFRVFWSVPSVCMPLSVRRRAQEVMKLREEVKQLNVRALNDAGNTAGLNDYGQLGTGGASGSATPVEVAGGHAFRTITCGMYHTCGLDDEGRAWCWGELGSGIAFKNSADGCERHPRASGGL